MLSLKQLSDYCMYDSEDESLRCRYLEQDEIDPNKYYCLKHTPARAKMDEELENFVDETKRKGKDPYAEGVPLGDHCQGYPKLKSILQGYDQDE